MRLACLTALIALALAALPAGAAAERSVPRGWLGVIADGPLTSGGAMDGEWDLMASSGAEGVRTESARLAGETYFLAGSTCGS